MSVYSSAIAGALRAIARKGDACVWRQYAVTDGDETWLEDETSPFIDYPVSIAFFPMDGGKASNTVYQQVAGDVTTFTSYAIMGAVPFTPTLRDSITRSDGTVLKPTGLGMLKPGAEVVLWQIGFGK